MSDQELKTLTFVYNDRTYLATYSSRLRFLNPTIRPYVEVKDDTGTQVFRKSSWNNMALLNLFSVEKLIDEISSL